MEAKGYFEKDYGYISLEDDGEICFETEVPCRVRLSENEVKQFFIAMMDFYKSNDNKFWESNVTRDFRCA